jgi:hypothetical protein
MAVLYCTFFLGVVPEYQCAVKREAKKAQKEKDRPSSSAMGSPDMKEQEVKAVSAPASVAPQHHHHQQVNHHHHHHPNAHLHHQQQQMMMIHVNLHKSNYFFGFGINNLL